MQSRLKEMHELGGRVLAISVDSPEQSKALAESAEITFPLLSDPECKVIDAYGLRHRGASINGGDIARPAVFIIDRDGKIAWRALTENWRVRVRPEMILEQLEKLP